MRKKRENNLKRTEATDTCQRIISAIVEKYIDKIIENNGRLEVSILQPLSEDTGRKIVIEIAKDADATIKVLPLTLKKRGEDNTWAFIEEFLPDYYHRDDILHYDIYSRYINNEDLSEGDAEWIYNDFGSDREKVKEAIEQMEKDFAYEALTSWLEDHGPECW